MTRATASCSWKSREMTSHSRPFRIKVRRLMKERFIGWARRNQRRAEARNRSNLDPRQNRQNHSEGVHDSQAEFGRVPVVFTEGQSKNRAPAQSRNIPHPSGSRETRAGSAVLQAPLGTRAPHPQGSLAPRAAM